MSEAPRDAALGGLQPSQLMGATVEALIEVGKTMLDLHFEPMGEISGFEDGHLDYGSCISMTRPGGSFNLALFGKDQTCKTLGRALLGMDPGEDISKEELADGLGEILNMVAGVIKRKMTAEEAKGVALGLPLFLSGTDCFKYLAKGIKVFVQRLAGPELDMEVIMVWKEGT